MKRYSLFVLKVQLNTNQPFSYRLVWLLCKTELLCHTVWGHVGGPKIWVAGALLPWDRDCAWPCWNAPRPPHATVPNLIPLGQTVLGLGLEKNCLSLWQRTYRRRSRTARLWINWWGRGYHNTITSNVRPSDYSADDLRTPFPADIMQFTGILPVWYRCWNIHEFLCHPVHE